MIEVNSSYVGRQCTPMDLEVTPRMIMNYAASTDDPNPWYFDDERPGGIVAPPMLGVALTWQISARFDQYWNSQDFPYEALAQQVHYSELFVWRRALVPGDKLRITGEIIAIVPHRAGTHLIIAYTARDTQGEVVFVEHIGGMLRGVKCTDNGAGKEHAADLSRFKTEGQAPLWENEIAIHPLAAHRYDGCADIHFPIHTSRAFAHAVGLPDIILHGTCTLSMALRDITDREAGGDPRRVRGVRCNFTGMVMLGTTIKVSVIGKEERGDETDIHFFVYDHLGKKAIRNACVTIAASV